MNLTKRENEVMRTMIKCCDTIGDTTNKDLAGVLNIAPCTVETHMHNICEKFEVKSRTAATVKWLREHMALIVVASLFTGCITTAPRKPVAVQTPDVFLQGLVAKG